MKVRLADNKEYFILRDNFGYDWPTGNFCQLKISIAAKLKHFSDYDFCQRSFLFMNILKKERYSPHKMSANDYKQMEKLLEDYKKRHAKDNS